MTLTTIAVIILSLWVVAIVIAGLVMALRPGGVGVTFGPATITAPTAASGTRQEIPLGGEAQTLGNFRGRVMAVLVSPDTRRLQGIQLGGGVLEGEAVPASAIVAADGQTVTLSDGWQDGNAEVDGNPAIFRGNMPVVGADKKRLGRLRGIGYDPSSGIVTALTISGRRTTNRYLVSMDRVVEVGPDRIISNIPASESGSLPGYATDWEIRQAINERLAAEASLDGLQRSLDLEVVDQRVMVQGFVDSSSKRQRLEQVLRQVPGVRELDLRVKTDEELAQAITEAIRRDPAASSAQVHAVARSGTLDIVGEAPDRATVRRIDGLTQQVGALVVHNMVTVRPTRPRTTGGTGDAQISS